MTITPTTKAMPSGRLVLLESPYKGEDWSETEINIQYARACMRDCFDRGEYPFASHLLYTQFGILNDLLHDERRLGIEAGLAWGKLAAATVIYADRGISEGMTKGIEQAKAEGRTIDPIRYLGGDWAHRGRAA